MSCLSPYHYLTFTILRKLSQKAQTTKWSDALPVRISKAQTHVLPRLFNNNSGTRHLRSDSLFQAIIRSILPYTYKNIFFI